MVEEHFTDQQYIETLADWVDDIVITLANAEKEVKIAQNATEDIRNRLKDFKLSETALTEYRKLAEMLADNEWPIEIYDAVEAQLKRCKETDGG